MVIKIKILNVFNIYVFYLYLINLLLKKKLNNVVSFYNLRDMYNFFKNLFLV